MGPYIARRLVQTVVVLLGVLTTVFVVLRLTGDPAGLLLPMDASVQDLEVLRHELGFDRPLYVQYAIFLRDVVQGDLGLSLRHGQPALELVLERLPATYELATVSAFIAVALALPIGVLSAIYRNSPIDTLAMSGAVLGQSVPVFWLGLMLIIIFGVQFRLLPISGRGTMLHLVLPSVTLGLFFLARVARLVRAAMLETLGQDYIRTARSKGLAEQVVVAKHALRNALVPVITLIGIEFGTLLGGAVITETVFAWPGVGRLIVQAIHNSDFPVVQAAVFVLAVTIVGLNLAIDLLYTLIDPRVRYS